MWRTGEGTRPDFLPSAVAVGASSHFGRGAFLAVDLAVKNVNNSASEFAPFFLDVEDNAAIWHASFCTL